MGQPILVLGESGTGKSTSLRNFGSDEICLIKTIGKNLPFKGNFSETLISDNCTDIITRMRTTKKKIIVIDDAQYIMSNEFFRRIKETGWDKYNDIGSNFYKILATVNTLPDDVFVYILSHIQTDSNGKECIKTIGKMLDEKLTIEGLATIVLKTYVCDGVYSFQTQNSGHDTCKSPIGMFSNYLIDNDLKMVDTLIREYWGLTNETVEEKGVVKSKPSVKNPRLKVEEEAKNNILVDAPVIKESKPIKKKSEDSIKNEELTSNEDFKSSENDEDGEPVKKESESKVLSIKERRLALLKKKIENSIKEDENNELNSNQVEDFNVSEDDEMGESIKEEVKEEVKVEEKQNTSKQEKVAALLKKMKGNN